MKAILIAAYFSRAICVFLAIVISGGRDNYFGDRNSFATAFCGNNNGIGRGILHRRVSSLSAGRGNDMDERVAYLEEEFRRSGDGENNDGDKDGPRKQPAFQTSVTTHTNAIDFLDQIENAPSNSLTVVLFFANYCKICQRAIVPFKQVANDSAKHVRFIRFETSALSPKEFLSLGIDRVPFLQIYRNGICVASFSATEKSSKTSRKLVLRPRVMENIDACERRSLAEWSAFRDRHDTEIEANKAGRAKIRVARVSKDDSNYGGDDEEERLYRSVRTLTSESELLHLLRDNNNLDEEYYIGDDYIEGGEENDIVVIMFHSHFDSSCLRAQHKFRKIAGERQKRKGGDGTTPSYTMARIESSLLSDETLQSLGIQRYPHIQIYWNSHQSHKKDGSSKTKDCVASFSIPRTFLFAKMLHESMDAIDQRTTEEWTKFYNRHREQIEIQRLALEGIVRKREL